ncbi:MAG: DUF4145 domain-containing protein, partial [Armatimonadetes bacterium]|nr:DUF4145 domain-containing protein [Armatimonadota bacterium]
TILCLACGNETPHQILAEHTESVWDEDSREEIGIRTYLFVCCGTCREVAVHHDEGETTQSLWPLNAYLGPAVPKTVQKRYRDALTVKKRLPSAFAVQIRRALEAMCTEQGVSERNLAQALTALVKQLDLPAFAVDMARVSRQLGNKGAHDGPDVTEQEAATLEDFFLALVEYVYIGPAKLRSYRAALSKLDL